jgi:CheY-like chemotaxis protein
VALPAQLSALEGGKIVTHVLVVDDDQDIRETLSLLLDDAGYSVTLAQDGRAALRALRASRSDCVVLLDITMPVMDGWAVLRAVRQDDELSRRHAFVIITAEYRVLPRERARMLAAWPIPIPVLPKPFNITDVLTVVEQAAQRLEVPLTIEGNRHSEQSV